MNIIQFSNKVSNYQRVHSFCCIIFTAHAQKLGKTRFFNLFRPEIKWYHKTCLHKIMFFFRLTVRNICKLSEKKIGLAHAQVFSVVYKSGLHALPGHTGVNRGRKKLAWGSLSARYESPKYFMICPFMIIKSYLN